MQLSSILVSPFLLAGLSAVCHRSGEYWPANTEDLKRQIHDWLRDTGGLKGSYYAGELKSVCIAISSSAHADLEIQRLGSRGVLTKDECSEYLRREIDACPQGGRRTYDNWVFSADPNAGPC
ncbi:hypothetical protein N657DRAFT_693721 [Parathielavia appendiculata]|uniref:Secreted protein n=1 Tax=Parathielavia appendiculata TaxID=2587402 RepID=A0AAN6TS73_9PEZI|nr:hypothetical protein N657DRAFT_693721 [Parathielavia appendiculata]